MAKPKIYTVRRRRLWTIEIVRQRDGGHQYRAWLGPLESMPTFPPVSGCSEGAVKWALADAIGDIDRLDGKPTSMAQEPRLRQERHSKWL